jgi:HD-like signal output (HDOD) protein
MAAFAKLGAYLDHHWEFDSSILRSSKRQKTTKYSQ